MKSSTPKYEPTLPTYSVEKEGRETRTHDRGTNFSIYSSGLDDADDYGYTESGPIAPYNEHEYTVSRSVGSYNDNKYTYFRPSHYDGHEVSNFDNTNPPETYYSDEPKVPYTYYQDATHSLNESFSQLSFTGPTQFNQNYVPDYKSNHMPCLIPLGHNTSFLRPKPKCLPIWLNGKLISNACADTGSEINCITTRCARSIGAEVIGEVKKFHLLIKGSYIKSVGVTRIGCTFSDEASKKKSYKFYVFKTLIDKVIMGREFLRSTQTLDLYPDRLKEIEVLASIPPHVRSIDAGSEILPCWLDGVDCNAVPDTGSDRNLISLDLADYLGCDIDQRMNEEIEGADCTQIQTVGTTYLTISLESSDFSQSVDLVDDLSSPLTRTGIVPLSTPIRDRFHIVDNMMYDALLGQTLLDSFGGYPVLSKMLVKSGDPHRLIMPIRRKKRREGVRYTPPVLTQEETLTRDIQNQQTRYSQEIQNINVDYNWDDRDPSYQKEVSDAKRAHLRWWSSNKEPIISCWGLSYYEDAIRQV